MKNGILIINKPKGYTSRDVVNVVCHKLNTKKVGHTGTLDPIAEGVLVIPVERALKISELLTSATKEYIAEVILGYETDTLDITGKEINRNVSKVTEKSLEDTLKSFIGRQNQEVPMYSAVKISGKKLYEYARNNTKITPPIKEIEVYDLTLLEGPTYKKGAVEFKIKTTVSKGTYIRALIRDIAYKLGTYGTMKSLVRTKQGPFTLEEAYTLEDLEKGTYKLLTIKESLPNIKNLTISDDDLLPKVLNGMPIKNLSPEDYILLLDKAGKEIAIYQREGNINKPYKMIEVKYE